MLLYIAGLPRSTYYWHVKADARGERYEGEQQRIAAIIKVGMVTAALPWRCVMKAMALIIKQYEN